MSRNAADTQGQTIGRRLLPMLGHTSGKRSAVTCALKCDNACFHDVPNISENDYFRDIAGVALSRRGFLTGAVATSAVVIGYAALGETPRASAFAGGGKLPFEPIAPVPAVFDQFVVPPGYQWTPIIRWGDPLFSLSDAFDPSRQTAALQERQFGYNNDYLDIIVGPSGRTAILVANQEYTNENIMFPPAVTPDELNEQRRVAMAAHGMAIVELSRSAKTRPWQYVVGAPLNRRLTASTPFTFSGPAAGSHLLKTQDDPTGTVALGTLGNCAGGTTPWGTVLSGEENFNGYFRTAGTSAADRRYGLADRETARGWEQIEPRFDARNPGYENEPNRFGWIVELDPLHPDEAPVKRAT